MTTIYFETYLHIKNDCCVLLFTSHFWSQNISWLLPSSWNCHMSTWYVITFWNFRFLWFSVQTWHCRSPTSKIQTLVEALKMSPCIPTGMKCISCFCIIFSWYSIVVFVKSKSILKQIRKLYTVFYPTFSTAMPVDLVFIH